MPRFLCLLIAGYVWITPTPAQAGDNAYRWLDRMSVAMSQMSYQGTFVYIQGDDVETMRITHVVDDKGGTRERLTSMSGSPRELLRDSKGVRWASSKDQAVMADAALNHPFFPELPLDDAARAQGSYQFRLAGSDRVAGHSGRRLDIVPKDAFRYGYSLWLETQSALLLQWKLSTSEGKDLARLMFTDFRIGSEVDRSELHSGMTGQRLHQLDSGIPAETGSARGQPGWKAKRLPPGFRLASHRQQKTTDGGFFEHSVYSDGIATVSVYVESADDGASIQRGLSRLGTTHAFTRDAEGYFITVIGDVPAATVKMIAEAVNHSDS